MSALLEVLLCTPVFGYGIYSIIRKANDAYLSKKEVGILRVILILSSITALEIIMTGSTYIISSIVFIWGLMFASTVMLLDIIAKRTKQAEDS